ncbi:MAG: hypothetical protein H7Z75_11050 [Ferruginibacter sp.]|nr:hypothetical protein [Cytophagales bacterium]
MYIRRVIRLGVMLRYGWKNALFFTVWATLVTTVYVTLLARGLDIRLPFLPLSTIGIAVAFYLGFKNNQAYERFWEARKLWGGIANTGRTWGGQVRALVHETATVAVEEAQPANAPPRQRELIYRQVAWAQALRVQLRRTSLYGVATTESLESQIAPLLSPAECRAAVASTNAAAHLLHRQFLVLPQLVAEGTLGEFSALTMMGLLKECYDLQGGCERIKNTPFPRQFAYFSTVFTWIFVLLVPLGLVGEFGKLGLSGLVWLGVPFSVLISWVFTTMEVIGDNSEDPFENYINDVPMTAICRNLEIELRELLGETELPARIQPVHDILL